MRAVEKYDGTRIISLDHAVQLSAHAGYSLHNIVAILTSPFVRTSPSL